MPFYGGSRTGFFYSTFEYAQKLNAVYENFSALRPHERLIDIAVTLDDILRENMDRQTPQEEDVYTDFLNLDRGPKALYFKPYAGQIELELTTPNGLSLSGLGNHLRFHYYHEDDSHIHFWGGVPKENDEIEIIEKDFGNAAVAMTKKEKKEFILFVSNILNFDKCRVAIPKNAAASLI